MARLKVLTLAVLTCLFASAAFGQVPTVSSIGAADLTQVLVNGSTAVGNSYATMATVKSFVNSGGAAGPGSFTTILGTSASATCLDIGAHGATNPVVAADCSTSSQATGIKVTGNAAATAPIIAATSSGTNENISVQGKGTGIVLLGQTICTGSGATPQACNGQRGIVTTDSLTTGSATNAAYVINNSSVASTSLVVCTDQGYSGTLVTNGYPVIMSCVPGSGTITVNITNTHAANALNGTVKIGFAVLN